MNNLKVKPMLPKLPRIKLALVREPRPANYAPRKITGPSDLEAMLDGLKREAQEVFVAVHLNTKNEAIAIHEVTRGTLSASLVHPREVFKAAMLNNAHSIIVAHNHPSGDSTPSREDFEVTEQLIKAGSLLGISVLDHVVLGDTMTSIRETKPMMWPIHD